MQKRAFTMVELIFVIVILGILAAIAVPKLSATRDDAQVTACTQDIKTFIKDIQGYTMTHSSTLPSFTDLQKITSANIEAETVPTIAYQYNGGNGLFANTSYKYNCSKQNTSSTQPSIRIGFIKLTESQDTVNITLRYGNFSVGPNTINAGETVLFILESSSTKEIDKLLHQRLSLIDLLNKPIRLGTRMKI